MTDDADCLRRYAEAADQAGFAVFVQRNVKLVYSAAYRQANRDAQLAEEITQEVFIAAARKAGALARHPVIAAWLHQTTRFVAIDAARSKRRRLEREATMSRPEVLPVRPSGPDPAEWERVSPHLDELIDSLGDRDRKAVVLRFLSERSFAEIGVQLGIGENGARMRVERALEKLRAQLARRGAGSAAAALGLLISQQGATAAPAGLSAAASAAAMAAPPLGLTAAAWSTFRIMSTAKITAGVATVVALLSATTALHEYRVAESAKRAAMVARADTNRAIERATSSAATALNQNGLAAARSRTVGQAQTATEPPAPPKSGMAAILALLDNPAVQSINALQARLRLDSQYGELFHALSLSPDQIEKFKQLIVEKEMVAFDSIGAARSQGIEMQSDPQGFFMAVAASAKTVDTQIAELLGPDGFQQFQTYQNSVPARNTISLLQQALSYSATPLTPAQNDQLIQALTAYGKPALPQSNPFAVLNGDLGVINLSPAGLAQIQSFLSAPQVAALQEKLQEQNQILTVRSRLGR